MKSVYLKAKGNEIVDADGRQLAVVLAANVPKSVARRWAQYIVDRENSVRRTQEVIAHRTSNSPAAR